MQIGIDISKAIGPKDGIGNYIYHLVRSLMEIDTENQYHLYPLFHPVTHTDFKRVFEDHRSNFVFHHERGPKPGEVELFHSTTYSVPLRYPGKLVFTMHDLTFITHPEHHALFNKIHCLKGIIKAACFADKIIAVSNCTKRDIVEYLGIPEEKIQVIYLAADHKLKSERSTQNLEYLSNKFEIHKSYILCVATIEPRKNMKRLIQAYTTLPETLKDKYLLVIAGGTGWLNSDIYSFVKEQKLEQRIKFLGYVDEPDLPILYSCCDVFVYPSLYEGFGLPVLEAMTCDVPVITSKVSSLPEVAGDAAVFVNPHDINSIRDALVEVLIDKNRNLDLRKKGVERSKGFSWAKTAKETLTLYETVVKSQKGYRTDIS